MGRDQGLALKSGTSKRVMDNPPARASSRWDAGETLAERFRAHARDAEHLYGYAIRGMADDWDAGDPVREVCREQTNEVGRSAALLAGLFDLAAASGVRRIRLVELGASAGLNLLLDYSAFRGTSWHFGSIDSKLQFVDPIEGPVEPERS
jgi:hypothetical protein